MCARVLPNAFSWSKRATNTFQPLLLFFNIICWIVCTWSWMLYSFLNLLYEWFSSFSTSVFSLVSKMLLCLLDAVLSNVIFVITTIPDFLFFRINMTTPCHQTLGASPVFQVILKYIEGLTHLYSRRLNSLSIHK